MPRRWAQHRLGGKKQLCCRTEHARTAWLEEVGTAGRICVRFLEGIGGQCAVEPLGRQVS